MSGEDSRRESKPIKIEEGFLVDDTKEADVVLFDIDIVPKIWDFIDAEKLFAPLKESNFLNHDFSAMRRKLYQSLDQFEDDIKQFDRNCRTQKQAIQRASKELISYVNEQIQLIKACKKCYENAHKHGKNSMLMSCSKPHLLLWVKAPSCSSYWPAKVMIVNAQDNTVYVRFFGDFSKSILAASKCFLFSKDPPHKKSDHQKSYQKAVKEAAEYAECMRFEFLHFNYAKPNEVFVPAKLADYLKQMTASRDELSANADACFDANDNLENFDSNAQDNEGSSSNLNLDADSNDASINTEATTSSAQDKTSKRAARKRSNKSFSIDSRSAKKRRGENDSEKATDFITKGMKMFNQLNNDNTDKINRLEVEMNEVQSERDALKQSNAKLTADMHALKQKHCCEKRALEEEKGALKKQIEALEVAQGEERKRFDNNRVALDQAMGAYELMKEAISKFK